MTPQEIQQLLSEIQNKGSSWATEKTLQTIAAKIGASEKAAKQIANELGEGIPSIGTEAKKVKINISENLKWATDKLGETFKGLSKIDTTNISSNFKNVSWKLNSFGKEIDKTSPLLSKFVGGLGSTVSVVTFLIEKFQESTTMLTGLYGSGVVAENGILGLSTAASEAGITAQKFAELLTKYSNVAIGTGYARVVKLSKMFADATAYGSKFIMSNEEAQEAILETMSLLQMSGRLRSMSDHQVVNAADDYVSEVNKLSEATGRNRKEIMAATKEALKLPYSFTLLNSLPPEMQKRFQSIATNMAGMFGDRGKDMSEELAKYLSLGVAGLGPEMKLMMTGLGGDVGPAFANLADVAKNGGDEFAATFKLLEAVQKVDTEQLRRTNPELLAYVSGLQQATKAQYEDHKRLMNMSESERKAELDKRKADKANMEAQQKVINDGRAALASMTNSIFQVIGALSPGLTTAFQALADATKYILENMMSFGRTLRDWIHTTFLGGTGDPKEDKRKANMITVVAAVVAGATGLFLVKSVIGLLIGGGLGLLTKGVGKLIGGALPALGGGLLSKLPGAGPLSKLPGGGPLKGLASTVGKFGTMKFLKGAAGLTVLAAATFGIAKALQTLNDVNWSSLVKGTVAIGGLISMAVLADKMGPKLLKGSLSLSVALGAISLAIWGSAEALKKFQEIEWETLAKAGTAIGALTLAASLIPAGQVIAGGAALGIAIGAIGGAMMLAGEGLAKFQNIDWETLAKAGVAIGAIALASALAGSGPQAIAIAAGGAAIGIAIAAIGAGIAGAAWLIGSTLPTLTQGLENLAALDYNALSSVGGAMKDLSVGLLALGGAQLVEGLSGFATGIINAFREDPIDKLKRFAEIGQPLKVAADALKTFSEVLPSAMSALSSLRDADKAIEVMNKLKASFSTGWFSTTITNADLEKGIFLILRKFADNREMISNAVDAFQRLSTLSNISMPITQLRDALQSLNALVSTSGNINLTIDGINRLRLAMNNLSTAGSDTAATPGTPTGPTITMNELNLKTVQYYEDSIKKFTELNDKIERTNVLLEVLRTSNTDNSNRIVTAVSSSGQRVQ